MASLPDDRFDVILSGDVRPDVDRETVVGAVARLIGRDEAFVRSLLAGQAFTVQSGVPRETAERSADALNAAGAIATTRPTPAIAVDAALDARVLSRPRAPIWNPNAAANWSILFTPVFGSWLHLKNWQALGRAERLPAARAWLAASVVVLLATVVASIVVPASDLSIRLGNFVWLIVWYFAAARRQARFVKQELGKDYARRGWWRPLLIAIVAVIALSIAVGVATSAWSVRVERGVTQL